LSVGGTGFESHSRIITEYLMTRDPSNCLVIWGASHWNRYELGYIDYMNNLAQQYAFCNFGNKEHLKKHQLKDIKHVADSLDYIEELLIQDPGFYMARNLRHIIHTTAWLRGLGVKYLVYNQACRFINAWLTDNQKYQRFLENDPALIDLRGFRMNRFLFDRGIEPEPKDIERGIELELCHPTTSDQLAILLTDKLGDLYRNAYGS